MSLEGDEEESVITMQEYIEEQEERVQEAVRVLGSADDKKCSYDAGYVKRQPLYSCLTCSKAYSTADSEPVVIGVCLGCSLHCHDSHELVELYTKRNFRCDCGNGKFGCSSFICALQPVKDNINSLNKYNQNFSGKYCTCHRPFPDPDNEDEDPMVQCIICEDWFHVRHANIDESIENEELGCSWCSNELPFLRCYGIKSEVDVEGLSQGPSNETDDYESEKSTVRCKKPDRPQNVSSELPTYFAQDWRKKLCSCESCLDMYKRHGCEYLLDPDDSCASYERKSCEAEGARRRTMSSGSTAANVAPLSGNSGESGAIAINGNEPTADLDALMAGSGMDRVQQLEMIHGFNHMSSELGSFLKTFAQEGKVVTRNDIYEFFNELQSKKRRKLSNGYEGV